MAASCGMFRAPQRAFDSEGSDVALLPLIRKLDKESRTKWKARAATLRGYPVFALVGTRLKHLDSLIDGLRRKNEDAQLRCTRELRRLLSVSHKPPIDTIVARGVVPRFVELLSCHSNPRIQFEAAWAITNIASGTSENVSTVVSAGAAPSLMRLFDSKDIEVQEQVIWAIGNISGDSADHRDVALNFGCMEKVVRVLDCKDNPLTMRRVAMWCIANMCRHRPPPDFSKVKTALSVLPKALDDDDFEIVTDACATLSYLTDDSPGDAASSHSENEEKIPKDENKPDIVDRAKVVLDSGMVPKIIELLRHPDDNVRLYSLRTLENIQRSNESRSELGATGRTPAADPKQN